jgi:hypothetical protein
MRSGQTDYRDTFALAVDLAAGKTAVAPAM